MHQLLRDAVFIGLARTAPVYRLFSIDDRYPAMVMANNYEDGFSLFGEIYDISSSLWPTIFENERRLGLYRGSIWLNDGTMMFGILSVRELCEGYPDISSFGGWKEYRASLTRRTVK